MYELLAGSRDDAQSSWLPVKCLGRDRELSLLQEAYQRAEQGAGEAVLLSGPARMGKSCLLDAFSRRLAANGIPVFGGRASGAVGATHPLEQVVLAVVRALSDKQSDPAILERARNLLATLQGRARVPARVVTVSEWQAERSALLEQLGRTLRECSLTRTPVRTPVVWLDDLDRAPSVSGLCAAIARMAVGGDCPGSGLLVVLSTRDPTEAMLQATTSRLEVGPIGLEGVRAALSDDSLVQAVLARTEGDPTRLAELVARLAGVDTEPPSLAIEHAELSVLEMLAVYGRPASTQVLQQIESTLGTEVLERLCSRGVLTRRHDELAFADSQFQETIYSQIPDDERQALHLQISHWCSGPRASAQRVEHLLRARVPLAVTAALEETSCLGASLAHERAIELLERALPLASDNGQRDTIEDRLAELHGRSNQLIPARMYAQCVAQRRPEDGRAQFRLGQLERLCGNLTAAEVIFVHTKTCVGDAQFRAEIDCELGEIAFARSELERAAGAAVSALQALGCDASGSLCLARISARNLLAKVRLQQGDPIVAVPLLEENLREARSFGLDVEEARALGNLGLAALIAGDEDRAVGFYREGIAAAGRAGDVALRLLHLQHLGSLFHVRAEYIASLGCYQEAVSIAKRVGSRSRLALLAADLAELYADMGDLPKSESMVELAERVGERDMAPRLSLALALARGTMAISRGDYARAEVILTSAFAEAESHQSVGREAWIALSLADLALQTGKLEEAKRWVDVCGRWKRVASLAEIRCAEILLLRGDAHRALSKVDRLWPELERQSLREGLLRAHVVRAEALQSLCRENDRERAVERANRIAAEISDSTPAEVRGMLAGEGVRTRLRALQTVRASVPPTSIRNHWQERFPTIVGSHATMQRLFFLIDRVACHNAAVLIRGESGTGKELVAEAIHRSSSRASGPLVKINCAAFVENLLLAELFGHERGAFTGALQRRKGHFESAHQGTIFLDEIGELSPRTQAALLRVLQERSFERVGGTTPIRVDVRVLCATHRNLEEMVAKGTFREDLYYRLQGIEIEIPSLRERIEDLPALCEAILARVAEERDGVRKTIAADAMMLLSVHRWPGNVRELENVLRSASLFSDRDEIQVADLMSYTDLGKMGQPREGDAGGRQVFERVQREGLSLKALKRRVEAECITRALEETEGNITRAAGLLRMKRPRLSQLIKELGVRDTRGSKEVPL